MKVKELMKEDIKNEIIEIMEKIVIEKYVFSEKRKIKKIIILKEIKEDRKSVMEYIKRMDNYDDNEIEKIEIKKKLFEEEFDILKKFDVKKYEIKVMIDNVNKLEREYEFDERWKENDVWRKMEKDKLKKGMVKEDID